MASEVREALAKHDLEQLRKEAAEKAVVDIATGADSFPVNVKTITGLKTAVVRVRPTTTVIQLQVACCIGEAGERLGLSEVPPEDLRFICGGKQLYPLERCMSDWDITKDATVYFVQRLRGGRNPMLGSTCCINRKDVEKQALEDWPAYDARVRDWVQKACLARGRNDAILERARRTEAEEEELVKAAKAVATKKAAAAATE